VSKLPVVSGAECVRALGKVGLTVNRQRGSHTTMVRKTPPSQKTIPNHKELDRGTLRAIIRQAGITVEEWVSLRWHAHLARDFTGGTPVPLFKLTHYPRSKSLPRCSEPAI
jgi:predicted RNA binding protein YcfA (HicA-like mRNA interferase family)